MSRHRHRFLVLILFCPALLISAARAQTMILHDVKTASPLDAGKQQTIQKAIQKHVQELTSGDPAQIKAARRSLINDSDTDDKGASPAYQQYYAKQIDAKLGPLTAPNQPRLVRLNASIVIGEVASRVSRTNASDVFIALATTLLQSNSFECQLWGIKTAMYALAASVAKNPAPPAALPGPEKKLVDAIVKVVKSSGNSGDLIEDAYRALTFEPLKADPNISKYAALTLPSVLDLIEWRTQQYANGLPVNPRAEIVVASFYPASAFDAVNANPQIRDRTLKAFGELNCAQLKAAINAAGQGKTGDQDLVESTRIAGSGLGSFGGLLSQGNPPPPGAANLAAAGQNVYSGVSMNTQPGKLASLCQDLVKALKDMNIPISSP